MTPRSVRAACALLCLATLLGLVPGGLLPAPQVQAAPAMAPGDGFADPAIRAVWTRADAAVAAGQANRSWLGGPGPGTTAVRVR